MTAQPEILPCPFCGNSDIFVDFWYEYGDIECDMIHAVRCRSCEAYGPQRYSSHGSIKAWNEAKR